MLRHAFRWYVSLCCLLVSLCASCARPNIAPSDRREFRKIEFAILEDYDKGEDLAEVAKDFDLFKELGATVWRGSFGWDDYEPTKGTYDFEWLHRFADLAASRGITLRPYIAYTPEWAAAGGSDKDAWNDPPKDLEDWYRFVRALASAMRRHPNVVSFEIYNEENVKQWWDGSSDTYAAALGRAADAVDEANPEAHVLLGGMVYPDAGWIDAVCQESGAGRRVDVIPFHAYPETWTPENVTVETYLGAQFASGFVADADAACGRKRVWINETGYATLPGRTEEDQARWWIRAAATFLSQPRIDHLGIYEIKDLRPDREAIGDAPNYHLGITYADRRRKMAFTTIRRLVSMLGDQRIATADAAAVASVSAANEDLHRYLFSAADGRQFLFIWTRRSDAIVTLRANASAGPAIEYAVDGSPKGEIDLAKDAELRLHPGDIRMFELRSRAASR
jgi:hypothetical protein